MLHDRSGQAEAVRTATKQFALSAEGLGVESAAGTARLRTNRELSHKLLIVNIYSALAVPQPRWGLIMSMLIK